MPDELSSFLGTYDPEVQALALGACALVRRIVPQADQKVLRPWKTIAYGARKKFCAVSPHSAWVNLQFHEGAFLADPSGLLEGTGKSMRHVKIALARDLKRRALASLIREAASRAK